MKSASDLVWEFIASKNIDTVFYVSGGGCIFLLDSLGKNEHIKPVATHHEQAAAIAAEGYARMSGKVGVCLVTSGPGGTNALTGTLCSWLDSIPILFISGNVNKELTVNWQKNLDEWDGQLRQLGDQEFNITETVKNMTKFSQQINEAESILYYLEKAYNIAISGRPGPVWIDIPLNIQSYKFTQEQISKLDHYNDTYTTPEIDQNTIDTIISKINNAKKPLIIAGNGIRLSGGVNIFNEFIRKFNLPVVTAVNGNDVIDNTYPYHGGRFGTHAQIAANKIIQNADLILTIGSRLYVRQTGYLFKDFGRNAFHIHVDIDKAELNKHTIKDTTDMKICMDAKILLNQLIQKDLKQTNKKWLTYIESTVNNNPTVLDRHRNSLTLSHYAVLEIINQYLPKDYHIVTSDGSANVVTMQVLKLQPGQRLFTNTGSAPMGYGLPASMGAAFTGNKILCLEGDGSIHLNIQELQTIKEHHIPLKVIILNNDGYLSIKITQKTMCGNRFIGSSKYSGLSFPNYEKLTKAYDLPYYSASDIESLKSKLNTFFSVDGPAILEIFTDPNEPHEPKVVPKLNNDGTITPGPIDSIDWVNK